MQIKNKIKINHYILGTFINFLWPIFLGFNVYKFFVMFLFLTSIVLNQYFLLILVADLTGVEKNTTKIPTFIYGILKLLLLIAGFAFAISSFKGMEHILVIFYLLQLGVLIASSNLELKQ